MSQQPKPILFGADYTVNVRNARHTLMEKQVDHDVVPVDIFAEGGPPEWYRALHPFSRIPAFEHDGLNLFETTAIARYVDEAFDGPALQPHEARQRAVMNQIIGLLDAYAYRALVWDIYVETVSKPRQGATPDDAVVTAALPRAEACLATLAGLKQPGTFLLGEQLTLADLHAAPMFFYFAQAAVAASMLEKNPALSGWWDAMQVRESFLATLPSS